MDLEQRLKETYAERLGALDVSGGHAEAARRRGTRMRVRRRVALGFAAATAVVVAVGGTLLLSRGHAVGPSHREGRWRELPAAPLSPRALALGVWTGRQVLYLGGERRPCAPIVSCDAALTPQEAARLYGFLRDGAAFDPATNTWRPIAPAPGYVENGNDAAFASGHLFVHTSRGWFSYSVRRNTWAPFDARWASGYGLSAVGEVIYGQARTSRPIAYDARTSRWTTYPADPIRPRLGGVTVSATPSGPVLGGYDTSKPYDVHRGSPAIVDIWDGHAWRRLPQTGQMERGWVWTGRRLVDPAIGHQDRGDEYRWPKAYPYGGILDPASGAWTPLPETLEGQGGGGWNVVAEGWPASVGGGDWFVVDGHVYDDGTGRAWLLPRPHGAPASYAAAAWAGGRLVAFGGADYSGQRLTGVTNRAWLYTP